MVIPHRPAVLAAKQLATIDVLSGGRVTLGIGAGWMKEEFEALGVPPFEQRGKVTDEYIAAFRELWTKDKPKFSGDYVKFDKISFAPKPAQKGGIPIWIGGELGPALRRTAKIGDAWYPIPNNPAFPLDSLARFGRGRAAAPADGGGRPRSQGRGPHDPLPALRRRPAGKGRRRRTPPVLGLEGRHRRRHQGARRRWVSAPSTWASAARRCRRSWPR